MGKNGRYGLPINLWSLQVAAHLAQVNAISGLVLYKHGLWTSKLINSFPILNNSHIMHIAQNILTWVEQFLVDLTSSTAS